LIDDDDDEDDFFEVIGGANDDWQGKPKYSEETCPGATLPTTNPT
jgi:hypothetical protein